MIPRNRRHRAIIAIVALLVCAVIIFEFREGLASVAPEGGSHVENLALAAATGTTIVAVAVMSQRLRSVWSKPYGAQVLIAMFGGGGRALYEKAILTLSKGAQSVTRVFGVWASDTATAAFEPWASRISGRDRHVYVPKGQSDPTAASEAHAVYGRVYNPIARQMATANPDGRLLLVLSTGGHTGSFAAGQSVPHLAGAHCVVYITGDSPVALLRELEDRDWGAKCKAYSPHPAANTFPANADESVLLTAIEAHPQQINVAVHKPGEIDIPSKDATDVDAIQIQAAVLRRTHGSGGDAFAIRQHEEPIIALVQQPVRFTQVTFANVIADMRGKGIATSVGANRRLAPAKMNQLIRADVWATGPANDVSRDLAARYLSAFCEAYDVRAGQVLYSPDTECESGSPVRAFVALEAPARLIDVLAPGARDHLSYKTWKNPNGETKTQ